MSQKSANKILWIVFLTVFLDMLGLGILIPIFPMLVATNSSFKIIPTGWTSAEGYIMLGWLMAVFPIFQFIFTPILGQLSDKFGRRRILVLSILGTACSYILFAFGLATRNLPILFIARMIDGISGANISTAQAVIGDISEIKARARNFGLIGMALGLGFILGPFFGGKLSDPHLISWFNSTTPFYFAAFMSICNFILVIKFLPETLHVKSNKRIDLTKPFHNIKSAFLIPGISSVIIPIFFFNTGFAFFTTFFGVVLAEKYGFNQSGIGDFFAYTGIMIVLSQGLLVRKLSGKIANNKVLNFSMFITGYAILVYYFIPANHINWLYIIPPLLAIGTSLTRSFSQALLTDIAPDNIRGEIMGINSSAFALSQIFPSVIAGYLAAQYIEFPIIVGGFVIIFGGIYFRKKFITRVT